MSALFPSEAGLLLLHPASLLDVLASILVQAPVAELPEELSGGILRAWSWPCLPLCALLLTTSIYLRGWKAARRSRPLQLPAWRAICFAAGILSLWIAVASPIDALDDFLLTAHMIQHFILMSVAPPLIVLGAPLVPVLRGLPRSLIRALRPLFASRGLRRFAHVSMHPLTVWIAMNVAYVGWHVPAAFELTFRSEAVHQLEHLCFLLTSIGFWWIILQPWPSCPRLPRWALIPYLLSADLVNTMLSAFLAFSGRVLYPSYASAPRICRLDALQDQVAAGSEMWVLNSLIYLVPAIGIIITLLSPKSLRNVVIATHQQGSHL